MAVRNLVYRCSFNLCCQQNNTSSKMDVVFMPVAYIGHFHHTVPYYRIMSHYQNLRYLRGAVMVSEISLLLSNDFDLHRAPHENWTINNLDIS